VTEHENSCWMPVNGKRAVAKDLDEILDDVGW